MNRRVDIRAWAVLAPGETADVAFVPPLVRRRLSPLQKIFFALAREVDAPGAAFVFASREGEVTLTRRIVEEFRTDGTVSPHRFSASVYNAAPGLWSVFTKNTAPYTAIAAGGDTLECGLLEALNAAQGGREAVFVYAEETGGGFGVAVRLADAADGAVSVTDAADGGAPLTRERLVAFVRDGVGMDGKWIAWRQFCAG